MINTEIKTKNLFTVRQFVQKHSWTTEGAVRYWIFNKLTNGFNKCLYYVGRKILIDEMAVFQWLEEGKIKNKS